MLGRFVRHRRADQQQRRIECIEIFAQARFHLRQHLFARASADDAGLRSFDTLFASGKPRCGQARDSQRELLFGADASSIGSVALVPLMDKTGPLGLLALGSTDRDRFHPGMSTEFLGRMAELIADALAPR